MAIGAEERAAAAARAGQYAAFGMAALTAVTFGLAIVAIPNSGANCAAECLQYPYLDSLAEFPGDYLWMPPALLLSLVYVIWMACIHACAAPRRQAWSQIALSLATMSAAILAGAYFVQVSVVPIGLLRGETEGLPLLTQYNPRGVFIALEELGYLLMSLSFLVVAPSFAGTQRAAAAARWVLVGGSTLALASLVAISAVYGLDRQDRFEVVVISLDWLVLLVAGTLTGVVFRASRWRGVRASAADD